MGRRSIDGERCEERRSNILCLYGHLLSAVLPPIQAVLLASCLPAH